MLSLSDFCEKLLSFNANILQKYNKKIKFKKKTKFIFVKIFLKC